MELLLFVIAENDPHMTQRYGAPGRRMECATSSKYNANYNMRSVWSDRINFTASNDPFVFIINNLTFRRIAFLNNLMISLRKTNC